MATKKTTTTIKKATVNFANMDKNVLTMLSNCQLAINALAVAEQATDKAKDKAKKAGKVGKDLTNAISVEKTAEKNARERCATMCSAFIIRNMSTEDITDKNFDIYHINWQEFLKSIGVVSDGAIDKKATDKIEAIISLAVDRYRNTVDKRKRGEKEFSLSERKEVKNNPIDLVSAFILAATTSGAIECVGGGLAVKDFSKK